MKSSKQWIAPLTQKHGKALKRDLEIVHQQYATVIENVRQAEKDNLKRILNTLNNCAVSDLNDVIQKIAKNEGIKF